MNGDEHSDVSTEPDQPVAYARIVSLRFRPETLHDAMDYFRDISAPLVRKQPGSISIFGAGNDDTGHAFALSFWETLESIEASNAHPDVIDALMGYTQWIDSGFVVEAFDVVDGSVPGTEPVPESAEWVRVIQVAPQPGNEAEVVAAMRQRLAQVKAGSSACYATLLMELRAGPRVMALEFWSEQASLLATESRADSIDARLWRSGVLTSPVSREIFRIYGRY